jgi:hypothetical protein
MYHVCPAYPVSSGHEIEEVLRKIAAQNACRECSTEKDKSWKLVRDLKAVEKGIGQQLNMENLNIVFSEWYRLSQPFLDAQKTRDDYFAKFLSSLTKVRVPTGQGNALNKALEAVAKLSPSQLPVIPKLPTAPESWRRLTALHGELSGSSANGSYFLSYRDALKACGGSSPQTAHTITGALVQLDVIEIVHPGKMGARSKKAAEFRYLLPPNDNEDVSRNGEDEDEESVF